MDDMASAFSSILNNPEAMQQIMGLAKGLGLSGAAPTDEAAAVSANAPLANNAPAIAPPPAAEAASGGNSIGLDINTLSKISSIMGEMSQRDQNAELLLALKPHFGEKRQKKVDDAIRIMQLIRVLPLLRETGLFGNLFGGDT